MTFLRDDFSPNRRPAPASSWSMMFSRPVFAPVEPAVPRVPARSRLLAAGCLGWPASGKWIKQRHTGGSDLRDITSHEREIMHFGGCGQKSIDQGQRIGPSQYCPRVRMRLLDGQHAIGESRPHL